MIHTLFVLSMWIHILAAATWVGGSLFLAIVLVPTMRDPAFRERGMELIHRVGRRFRWVGWICFALLILTGMFNLLVRSGMSWELLGEKEFWSGSYGKVLAWKLLLVGIILILSAVHDFLLGPLAVRASAGAPVSFFKVGGLRLAARWMGRFNLLLGLIVIGLGVTLVRGWPF